MLDRLKLATALDKLADYVDTVESEKLAASTAERTATVDKLASAYLEATGDELPDDVRQKLANSDKAIVNLVQAMTEKQAAKIEEMGGPSALRDGGGTPLTVKEAADAASQRFESWITG